MSNGGYLPVIKALSTPAPPEALLDVLETAALAEKRATFDEIRRSLDAYASAIHTRSEVFERREDLERLIKRTLGL